jgi:hypothetical protein
MTPAEYKAFRRAIKDGEKCFACGCIIHPEQKFSVRGHGKNSVMRSTHDQCEHALYSAYPVLIQSFPEESKVERAEGFLTTWPSRTLSDEWKDFWMECRKRDQAEIDKARGLSPRAKGLGE